MSNLVLGHLNRADSATLAATSEATLVANLQSDDRGYLWRSTGLTSQVLSGSWGGTAYSMSMVALYRHNLTDSATIRVQLYSDVAMTTQVKDTGAVASHEAGMFSDWGYGFSIITFATVTGVKAFKITIADASNPDGYIEAARLFVGSHVVAPYNPKYGVALGVGGSSTQSRRPMGALDGNRRAWWRTLAFDMFVATEADRAQWFEIGRACDRVGSFVVSVFPDDGGTKTRDYAMMAKFTTTPAQVFSRLGNFDFGVKLEEI